MGLNYRARPGLETVRTEKQLKIDAEVEAEYLPLHIHFPLLKRKRLIFALLDLGQILKFQIIFLETYFGKRVKPINLRSED